MDSDILLQDEIRALTKEEKQQLLHDADITVDVQPIHELAMKSMLGIHAIGSESFEGKQD